jgi:hypothetical protein
MTVPALATEAAEVRPADPAPDLAAVFVRAGAGFGRGEVFLGSANARGSSRIPIAVELGKMVGEHLGVSAFVLLEPGWTAHGVAMSRIALGASVELHYGPVFFGGGAHATWFGVTRKSAGPAGGSFMEAEHVLWRLGPGVHAIAGVEVRATTHVGFFTAVRGDADVLLSWGSPSVPYGSITGVVGMSFY